MDPIRILDSYTLLNVYKQFRFIMKLKKSWINNWHKNRQFITFSLAYNIYYSNIIINKMYENLNFYLKKFNLK